MERDYLNEDKEFYPNTNGEISSSITQSWTEQAMECYSIGCDCRKCSLLSCVKCPKLLMF